LSKRIEKGFKDFTSQDSLDAIWKDSDKEDFCGNESKDELDEQPID